MAAEEPTNPAPEGAPPSPAGGNQPNYPEMIMAAIESLNDKNGSNKSAISRYIEASYSDLPPSHSTLIAHYLNKMKLSGEIVMAKNNYMKPDPNAPPKRGRGRPPKPKEAPAPAAVAASSPRPRGRPPKPKDQLASRPPPPPKRGGPAPTVTGKKRGRPPKAKPAAAAPAAPVPAAADGSVVKRGRGRPPKVKPAVAPVGA
ncbi:HMG-Y-related protein A-like [Punica granatum]|uniref:HMG-Y-related protein A n=2 Tax=Punica granatum TaxID=22663 RepID=A0A218XAK2_PUNGR|nr:HMG-Y-related protein A-like [Punica granatum]OWM81987.1 hypothetical protein CDL15_Pgr016568 [Punica granatum]PKI37461.1 hypothetical protein CRG98_042148 [Punica granatum]